MIKKFLKNFEEFIYENKNVIVPPNIPNTLNFWHGGNLDEPYDVINQKNGRYEYGAGLYLTSSYNVVTKYTKGNRKLYLITVQIGNDINKSFLDYEKCLEFINDFVISSKKKMLLQRLSKHIVNEKIKAYVFNNIILNEECISSSKTKYLRQFYIDNSIDYEIIDNAFGWGETMMVLYNMKKIVNIIKVNSGDVIEQYDL